MNGSEILKRIGGGILDILFPPACGVCGADPGEDRPLCRSCRDGFPRWTGLICRICGLPLPDGGARCRDCRSQRRAFRFCRSAGLHQGSLRRAVLALKYQGRESLAVPLGDFLASAWTGFPEFSSVEALVPIPLHFIRRHARGFNQAERLARRLSLVAQVPLAEVLARPRWTKPQAGLDRAHRLRNMNDVFRVLNPSAVTGRHLLLIDDVCTTGATLDACAQILRAAGARRVDALVLARDV